MILQNLILSIAANAGEVSHAADTAAAAHGGHGGGSEAPELPNILQMLYHGFGDTFESFYHWENIIFGFFILSLLCIVAMRVYTRRTMFPGRLQNIVEMTVEGLDNFFHTILGNHARRYTPFLGTLFIYILLMNLMGLVPFLKSPSSSVNITLSLSLIVFIYVQFTGVRRLGPGKYLLHLAGDPKGVIGWMMVPLNLPIHIVGELAKPVSLGLRLFGNVTGEDVLIAAFTGLGIMVLSFTHLPIGLPLQFPFYFLAILTSAIQALVFTLLSAVYFAMMLPHEEGH